MALRDFLAIDHSVRPSIEAAESIPVQSFDTLYAVNAGQSATRDQAMAIPTVARARNIICSTIGSLPLEWINEATNTYVPTPRVINQRSVEDYRIRSGKRFEQYSARVFLCRQHRFERCVRIPLEAD